MLLLNQIKVRQDIFEQTLDAYQFLKIFITFARPIKFFRKCQVNIKQRSMRSWIA